MVLAAGLGHSGLLWLCGRHLLPFSLATQSWGYYYLLPPVSSGTQENLEELFVACTHMHCHPATNIHYRWRGRWCLGEETALTAHLQSPSTHRLPCLPAT